MDPLKMENNNLRFQEKFKVIEKDEVRYETIMCDDAEYVLVAFGTSSRICQKAIEIGRAKGIRVGLLRPITLWPFPSKAISEMTCHVKGFLSVEMSSGQMVDDVKLAIFNSKCTVPVEYFGRMGGILPSPNEVIEALENKLINR